MKTQARAYESPRAFYNSLHPHGCSAPTLPHGHKQTGGDICRVHISRA